MFALKGRGLIDLVLQHLPEGIERLMQKRHTKWCDSAWLVPWSVEDEVGATLRVTLKSSQDAFSVSWGAALNDCSKVEIYLYDGDVANWLCKAATGEDSQSVLAAREEIRLLSGKMVRCLDAKDLVGKVIEKIQSAVVAHKMLEAA